MICKSKKMTKKIKYLVNQAKDDKINFIHNDVGYNFGLSNINAAIGYAQLKNLNKILKLKKNLHLLYRNYFSEKTKFSIIEKPNYSVPNYWLNIVDLKSRKQKNKFFKNFIKIYI